MKEPDSRTETHYDVLGIPSDADGDAIRKARKIFAHAWHPDINPAPGAADRFKRVEEAYRVLSDPARRAQYDQAIRDWKDQEPAPDEDVTSPPPPPVTHPAPTYRAPTPYSAPPPRSPKHIRIWVGAATAFVAFCGYVFFPTGSIAKYKAEREARAKMAELERREKEKNRLVGELSRSDEALKDLLKFGGEAYEPLARCITDSNDAVRARAAWGLGALKNEQALDVLLQALRDPSEKVRRGAAWALGQFGGSQATRAVAPLIDLLSDESEI